MIFKNLLCTLPLIFACLLISCEKDSKDSWLYVDSSLGNGINISFDASNYSFTIKCNTDWSVEILSEPNAGTFVLNDPKGGGFNRCDWLQVYPAHGSGNATISVSVEENSEIYSRDAILVVRTNDGRHTENVWFLQDGKELPGYETFEVYPTHQRLFNGKIHDVDTLYVISPHGAEISGPSWIEAKVNTEDWKPLSDTKPRYIPGLAVIALRTANANLDEADLEGLISVCDTWHENYVDIEAIQLGRYHVRGNKFVSTADGFACDWRYGCDVTGFYIKAFEGAPTSSDLRWTKIQKWQMYDAEEDLVIGWYGLKEQTRYEVIAVGIDNSKNHSSSLVSRGVTTGSSINQPRAFISDVSYVDPVWQWNTTKNEFAAFYYNTVWNANVDRMADAWMKWVIMNHIEEFKKETESSFWNYTYNDQIHLVTMAYDNTNAPSYVLDRYSTANSSTRFALKDSCMGLRLRELKQILLKVAKTK